ncbi:MAG: DUF1203 domain-containing protein [Opitutae bacterium]|nr:DUF1203 domain-containing protein [Opitutae bacterium]
MNSTATPAALSFQVSPLPDGFVARLRATGRDDFGRPARPLVAQGWEPLRDQLRRAAPGEPILLCSYQAVPLPSTFAEIGPVYVGATASAAPQPGRDELPPGYFDRPFALRAYNAAGEIIDAAIVAPAEAPALIRRWLARAEVARLHARFGAHGCYACRIDRAE